VERLITSVEGGISESGNETVPAIARLADDLLRSEPPRAVAAAPRTAPSASAPRASAPETSPTPQEYVRELEDILELNTPAPESEPAPAISFGESLNAALAEEEATEEDEITIPSSQPIHEDSASEGIRNLISRIENAVASPSASTELNGASSRVSDAAADEEDEDLARELQEIEALRNELNGLRNKISAGA